MSKMTERVEAAVVAAGFEVDETASAIESAVVAFGLALTVYAVCQCSGRDVARDGPCAHCIAMRFMDHLTSG